MAPRILLLVLVQLAALVLAAPAAAQGGRAGQQQNLLALGHQQYDNLHFEEAVQTLSAAIIRRGNSLQDEIHIYELLGLSYLALNRNDEAEGAYRLVLVRDPNHAPPADESPRFIEFFNGVRQRWEAEGRPGIARATPANNGTPTPQPAAAAAPVTIEHRSPPQQNRNTAVVLSARVTDPNHRVSHMVLAYRAGSSGLFRRIDTTATNGEFRGTIPASSVRPPLVEYYFEAVDAAGVPVQARGDAYAPLRIAVPEPGGVPWWLIAGGAVVVVGGAAAIIAVLATQNHPPTQEMPAHLTIGVVGQ